MRNAELKTLLLIIFVGVAATAELPIDYRISVDGILDNREYGGPSPLVDQTFFLIRPEAEVGFLIDDVNSIRAGFNYTQEFGAKEDADNLNLLVYYYYNNEDRMRFRFGAFPRAGALSLPSWFFSGEYAYRRPYVHGALFEIAGSGVGFRTWVDWVGRQSADVNEEFLFGTGVDYRRRLWPNVVSSYELFARHDFIMRHYANTRPEQPNFGVRDNGGMSVEVGAAWGEASYLDTLSVSGGAIVSFDRDRSDGVWRTPVGGFATAYAGVGFFAARGFVYGGQPQILAYGEEYFNVPSWASSFDPYKGTTTIARLDLIARFIRNERVKADLYGSFYLFDGSVGYSQHFELRAEIGRDRRVAGGN